jgi:hypothetical protein
MSAEECIERARQYSRQEGVEVLAYRHILCANGYVSHYWLIGSAVPDLPQSARWEPLARFLAGEPVREAFVARLVDSSTDEQVAWFAALGQRQREELGNLIRSKGPFNGDLIGDWVEDHGAPRDWHIQIVYERRLVHP